MKLTMPRGFVSTPLHVALLAHLFVAIQFGGEQWGVSLAAVLPQKVGELEERSEGTQGRINQLIDDLAHPQYSVRRRARYELEVLGLHAVDGLQSAQNSANVEIATAARTILSGLQVRWIEESDVNEVRQVLEKYGDLDRVEKASRLERLAQIPESKGVDALIRVCRYEQDLGLSRHAATLVIQPVDSEAERRAEDCDRWEAALGDSKRIAVAWLQQWIRDQRQGKVDREAWIAFLQVEKNSVDNGPTGRESKIALLSRFYQAVARHAVEVGDREFAKRLASDAMEGIPANRRNLIQSATWALDVGLIELVPDLFEKHAAIFADEPELLYLLAEAYGDLGLAQRAEQMRQEALAINPLPDVDEEQVQQAKNGDQIRRLAMRRRELAYRLAQRGLFAWAESENLYVIEHTASNSIESAIHRSDLVDLYSMLDRHAEIVEILSPLVERLSKDAEFRERCRKEIWIGLDEMASQLEFHRSHTLQGDAARQSLRTALGKRRDNPDIVIAMYQLGGDEAWKEEVQEALLSQLKLFSNEVRRGEESIRRGSDRDVEMRLARACNNFAWLVCKTQGDLAQAIRWSQRSLELEPRRAEYFDTLACCYAQSGQLDEAVRYQRRAVALAPHFPPIAAQLELYESQRDEEAAGGSDEKEPDS